MQFIFSTTLLLYKLDTLLLKQKNLPVLDITSFFFRIRTQVTALVRKRNPLYPIPATSFVSIVLYLIHTMYMGSINFIWSESESESEVCKK